MPHPPAPKPIVAEGGHERGSRMTFGRQKHRQIAQRCARLLTGLLVGLALMGCEREATNVNIRLTMEERDELDTRIIAHMDSLRPALDSTCEATREARVAAAVDSIVQERLEEEARMRARIPQNLRSDR